MNEAPHLPEVKLDDELDAKVTAPDKAAEWLLHNEKIPPVPPPIYEVPRPEARADIVDKPETFFERRHETLEDRQAAPPPRPAPNPMVPLGQVLANHPQNPGNQRVSTEEVRRTKFSLPPALQSIVASPIYRRALVLGVAGGFSVLLVILLLGQLR